MKEIGLEIQQLDHYWPLVLHLCFARFHPSLFRRSREVHAELESPIAGQVGRRKQAGPKRCAQKWELESASDGHFVSPFEIAIEGMESCDDLFQFIQAKVMQSALQVIAIETDTSPSGREVLNTAGLNTKATSKNATVVVYPVPVDFSDALNIATSSVDG
jgi:hypothetical protein